MSSKLTWATEQDCLKSEIRASKVTQWVRLLSAKPESSISGNQMEKRESISNFYQWFSDLHKCTMALHSPSPALRKINK